VLKVKICGITRPEDARAAAAAGADALGLNFFAGSPRCVSPERAAEIVAAIPAGICKVGVFVDAPRERVRDLAERLALDALQFHGEESSEYCRGWTAKLIKAVRVRDAAALAAAAPYAVDFLLADAWVAGRHGGTGRRVPAEWLSGIDPARLILAGGLDPDNVADAVRAARPAAVDVASGVESAPGVKDAEAMRRFIANAKNA
jgi:phosphoribosylanthranilate isomerase